MATLQADQWSALFPDKPSKSREDIERCTGGLRFTESTDGRLHFTLLVPLGWRWRPASEAHDPPGLLVSLVFGTPATAEIAVFVDDVPREVSPAEWAAHRLERVGHTLSAKREEYTPIGLMADLLTCKEGPEGGIIARTNMAKDGRRIFTVTCQARAEDYPRWACDFYVALASFKLLHPERAPLAEALTPYCYLYPAVIGFSRPASWVLVEEALTEAECSVRLDDMSGDGTKGSIHVWARPDVPPKQMVAALLVRVKREGVHVADRPSLEPCDAPTGFAEASSLLAEGTSSGHAVELRAMVLTTPAATLLLSSRGPTRAHATMEWMVRRRAFEIVRDTAYAV